MTASLLRFQPGWLLLLCAMPAAATERTPLSEALTFHASFDDGMDADFSRGSKTCQHPLNRPDVTSLENPSVVISQDRGRFGNALRFTRKSSDWPRYQGKEILNYGPRNWSTTVSVWLRLDPDRDLEPGYCDPIQIVGDDLKKGFVFLEWSKDETPRFFRYAIRPLFHIWNPDGVKWDEIPAEKRPMVQIANAPFSSDRWTHVLFTVENGNDSSKPQIGKLYLNGELAGSIQNWDLTFGWNPEQTQLVLGAAYVGEMDDLAVFNRALTDTEARELYELKEGVSSLYKDDSSAQSPGAAEGM